MGMFSKFRETVIYKEGTELEKQIDALNKVIDEYPDNAELNKKLKLCEIGLKGEKEIEFELKNANIGMYVLHDINLEYEDLKAQIDYVIITPAKIYYIECKNLVGNITINSNGDFIREWTYNGHKIREGIYSPLRQAERHIEVYKKIWKSRNSGGLLNSLAYRSLDQWDIPLVVMANEKNILNSRYAPKEVRNRVVRSDQLVDYLKKDIAANKDFLSSQKDMQKIADNILKYYNKEVVRDYETEYREYAEKTAVTAVLKKTDESAEQVNRDDSALREKMIRFRKERSTQMNIPAYYIFTNSELDQLIAEKPETLEELRAARILSAVKVNCHGKEIISALTEK